jgi:hypothetical protein
VARPRKHPLVPVQVRAGLLECRARGLDFDEGWDVTVGTQRRRGTVRYPHSTEERRGWKAALAATRSAWEAAYNREPTGLSLALDELTEAFDQSTAAVPIRQEWRRPVRQGFVLPPRGISRPLTTVPSLDRAASHERAVGKRQRGLEAAA